MKVRVLGPVDVSAAGAHVRLGGEKQRLVFAVLAARYGSVVSREMLTDALWPSAPPASARHTVEAYVSRLRVVLRAAGVDNVIEGGSGGYRLCPEVCELDRRDFEDLAAAGRSAHDGGNPGEAAQLFARALDCWRGPAFTGFDGHGVLRAEAAALNEARLQVLEQWGVAQLELGRMTELVRTLRSVVGEHPARERLHELLIMGLYGSGDQVGALGAFQELRTHLVDEFGIEPSQALRDLQRRVLHQDPCLIPSVTARVEPVDVQGEPVDRQPAIPVPLRPSGSAFVGRAADLAYLAESLETCTVTGQRQLLLIGGEPGIGKSRLCREFAQGAQATVLYGRCDEEQLLPLQPFVEALHHHASTCEREELERQVLIAGGELSRILSNLPARVPGLEPPLSGDPDGARVRLFEAIKRLLRAASQRDPLVLVLEDLQWADPLSLMLLKFLVRHLEAAPILLVGTYRTTDIDVGHPLARALADLRSDCSPAYHELRPLDAGSITRLAEDWAGCEVSARVGRTLLEVTDGNPFFAVELLRHLSETGEDLTAGGVPQGVQALIGQRLDRLDEGVRRVLSTASTLGREFGLRELRAILQLDDSRLIEALDQAASAHLVHELADQCERYAFSHALTRETVYFTLSRARRAAQHRQVAIALSELHRDDRGPHDAEIARHWASAGTQDARRRSFEQVVEEATTWRAWRSSDPRPA